MSQAQAYNLYVIGPTASIPAINVSIAATGYHSIRANSYIAPPNGLGWRWKVRVMVSGIWSAFTPEQTLDVETANLDCQQAEPTLSISDATVNEGNARAWGGG